MRKAASALLLAVGVFGSAASAEPLFKSDRDLIASKMPAFVNIYNRAAVKVDSQAGAVTRVQDDVGSGFIIDPSGIIVTNRHVIEGAYALFVTLNDGRHVPAKLLGKALTFDIALLKVDVDKPLPTMTMGDSSEVKVGDRVIAIGNPLGFASSASAGIVSALHRNVGLSAYDDLMQTDATINQGNSGGPLINMAGEVVGVNEAIYTRNGGGSIGIGFSIPINEVKFLIDVMTKHGRPKLGWLGASVQNFTAGMARSIGLDGALGAIVSDIAPNGSAAAAGLQVGDVILAVGATDIAGTSSLNRAIAPAVDTTVQMKIARGGKIITLPVAIREWPSDLWSSKLADPPQLASLADFGLVVVDQPGGEGPLVQSVAEKSIAWSAGFRPGDVVRRVRDTDVRTADAFQKEILEHRVKGFLNSIVLLKNAAGSRWVDLAVRE
ncbi:MAG: trypsin-like peptidase domain-containing protein [Rhodoblastus sp.]